MGCPAIRSGAPTTIGRVATGSAPTVAASIASRMAASRRSRGKTDCPSGLAGQRRLRTRPCHLPEHRQCARWADLGGEERAGGQPVSVHDSAECLLVCGAARDRAWADDATDMDGYALVPALLEGANLEHIPLLVYSALDAGNADQARLRLPRRAASRCPGRRRRASARQHRGSRRD